MHARIEHMRIYQVLHAFNQQLWECIPHLSPHAVSQLPDFAETPAPSASSL